MHIPLRVRTGWGIALVAGMVMTLATAAGALSSAPTAQDQRLMQRAAQHALETNPVGESARWRDPETGHMGAVTPLRNYRLGMDQPCRDYEMTLTAAGRTEAARYSACRHPNGDWVNRESPNLAGSLFAGRPVALGTAVAAGASTVALTARDQRLMERAAQDALERNRTGQTGIWRNPDTGREGAVTPLRNYRLDGDRPCRDYEMAVTTAGAREIVRYSACRQPDGLWVNRADGTVAGRQFAGQPVARGTAQAEVPPIPLSRRDQELMESTVQAALEGNPIGQTSDWSNSETGHVGGVTPLRSYEAEAGRPCRDYRMTVTTNGPTWVDNSTACRLPDGSWMDQRHSGPAGGFFEGRAYLQPEETEPPYYGSPPGLPRRPATWDFPDR